MSEASSEVKERVVEEMIGKAASNGDVPAPSNMSLVVDAVHGKTADGDAVVVKDKVESKAASGARGDTYSYAFAQVKPLEKGVAEIWSHFIPSPKHDQIVKTSPDVFGSLPEFFSSRFKYGNRPLLRGCSPSSGPLEFGYKHVLPRCLQESMLVQGQETQVHPILPHSRCEQMRDNGHLQPPRQASACV